MMREFYLRLSNSGKIMVSGRASIDHDLAATTMLVVLVTSTHAGEGRHGGSAEKKTRVNLGRKKKRGMKEKNSWLNANYFPSFVCKLLRLHLIAPLAEKWKTVKIMHTGIS